MTLDEATREAVHFDLAAANAECVARWPGEPSERQPLHTLYEGAQFFDAGTCERAGQQAREALRLYAPDGAALAEAFGLGGDGDFHERVWARVAAKLEREPVEDFRLDFEDGFGVRPDREEDGHAVRAAGELARADKAGRLPPFVGIRIKPLNDELARRSIRTLDLFVTTLVKQGGGLPRGFVITLPKIPHVGHVQALVTLLEALETQLGLEPGALVFEIMVELPQTIFDGEGRAALPALVDAGRGRMRGAHFGTYDYTAATNISAAHQAMDHPVCDFAKHVMKASLAGTGVTLSDGSTNILPVEPHPGGPGDPRNRAAVHAAWRLQHGHVRHSLAGGFYQGWDLHPVQMVARYTACFGFFLEGIEAATTRLRGFFDKAAKASEAGGVFDDVATGQVLLNTLLRAWSSGAVGDDAVAAAGLTLEELAGRSFAGILARRGP